MAYNPNKPANDGYLAEFPPEMREQLRAITNDQIVDAQKLAGLSPGNLSGNIPVSNGTLCNNLNADKLDGNEAAAFAAAGHVHPAATTSINGFMIHTDKAKLDSVATGAEVNQNAFSNVKVGSTTIQADSETDTLELVAGANIALTPDATNDRVTVAVTGTVANAAACTGNAATATTASACSGNAATATKLQTARTINGVSFDGSANITVTAAANGGTSAVCTGNAATATKLQTARTVALTGDVTGSGTFDGSQNISIAAAGTVYSPNCILPGSDGAFSEKISMGSGLQAKVAPFEALIGRKYHSLNAETALTLAARKASLLYAQKASSGSVPTIGKVDAVYPEPDDNTVAQWRFNATGTISNYAVGKSSIAVANNLIPNGTLTRVDGWCDYGIQGDGSTGYYNSGNNTGFPTGAAERELDIVYTPLSLPGGQHLLCGYGNALSSNDSGFEMILSGSRIQYNKGSAADEPDTGFDLEIGKTYYLVLGYTGTKLVLYVNGVLVWNFIYTPNTVSDVLKILHSTAWSSGFESGVIHYVELRNRMRSSVQIGAISNRLCLPCRYTGYASTYPANDSATGSHIYKFDETSGTAVTDETGTLNGTANGTTIVTSEMGLGYARRFSSSGDYISLGNITTTSTTTIIAILNSKKITEGVFLNIGGTDSTKNLFKTTFRSSCKLDVYSPTQSADVSSDGSFPTDLTAFAGFVFQNDTVTFYCNSPYPDSTKPFKLYIGSSLPSYIGRYIGSIPESFTGNIEYLAIIPRALSQAEIAQHYNALMITADKNIINDILPADSISLGFVRTDSTQMIEVDDSSYKYGRREGFMGGNRKVFLGWKYASVNTLVSWDIPFGTNKYKIYIVTSSDALGSNEMKSVELYNDTSGAAYGYRPHSQSESKFTIWVGNGAFWVSGKQWVSSGYIGCYAEVIE